MFASKLQIRLPRRVTAYFLLFGMAALLWLSVAVLYVAHSVTETRAQSASLRSLGQASGRFNLTYLRNKSADFQPLLQEIRTQSRAAYCAVVADSGEYLAHTTSAYKGKSAAEQGNVTDRWGEVVELRFVGDDGKAVCEYRAPLKPGGKSLGTLRLGFAQTSIWGYLATGAQFAPFALIGPACCMVAGAVLVNRMVRPVADIEQQLYQVATSPSVESCELHEVPSVGAAAMGWNRVIQRRSSAGESETLQRRIRTTLEHGRHSQLDTVLNSIPEGVATTDADGRLTYMNLPMSVLLGLSDAVRGLGGASEGENAANMTDQLTSRWNLPENDPLLASENRDRAVVTELTKE